MMSEEEGDEDESVLREMDFHSAIETYAEAWVAANTCTPFTRVPPPPAQVTTPPPLLSTQYDVGDGDAGGMEEALLSAGALSGCEEVEVDGQIASPPTLPTLQPATLLTSPTSVPVLASGSLSFTSSCSKSGGSSVSSLMTRPCGGVGSGGSQHSVAAAAAVASSGCGGGSKSMPVHCVVQQVTAAAAAGAAAAAAAMPVTSRTPGSGDGGSSSSIELDTYTILPSSTPFCHLISAACTRLGYSHIEAATAKGCIELPHWKPLRLGDITEDDTATLQQILGQGALASIATLRITVYRCTLDDDSTWTEAQVRCAVLELLKEMTQVTLARISPLSQTLISHLVTGRRRGHRGEARTLSHERCAAFARWYKRYMSSPQRHANVIAYDSQPATVITTAATSPSTGDSSSASEALLPTSSSTGVQGTTTDPSTIPGTSCHGTMPGTSCHGTVPGTSDPGTSAPSTSTTAPAVHPQPRYTFHPTHEIPLLRSWYEKCPKPSAQDLQRFTAQLNAGHIRQHERPAVDVWRVRVWWKNERQRRARLGGRRDSL